MLKLSVLPENLPCREAETATIREFIKTAVRTTGTSGNVLYISGVPGTGKTASVLSVVTAMQKHSKDSEKFEFAYINSMKLNTPTDLYVDLLNKLWLHKRKFASDKPQEKLTEFFASNDKNRPITVLLVDEIDYLVTKSQAVVYQLFDWPLLATSKLVLLTISNTMDLPERLMPRVASRLGLARLNYLPYNHEQIKKVISERMRDAKAERIFADDAVTFVARRVAASSGDIRKALHICRRAIEMREGPVVKAADINRAQFDLYSNPYVAVISHLPYFARLVMIAMVKETTVKNAESVNLRDIWLRFSNLLNSHAPAFQTRKFYYSDFQRVLTDLAIMNLVQVSKFSGPAPCDKPQVEIVTPGDEEGELMEAGSRAVSKNQTGKTKKCKVVAKDNGAEEDEDGSGYLVSLNPLIENKDVKHALVEEAGDRVAQRWLL
jgi:Cdc6-like AAA superfamily ATPase